MRTKNSFYNFFVSIVSGLIIPIFGFVKVRLFIDLYGSDLNGLYLVFMNVINFINICEYSFSLAFRQLLYKPLAENDHETVNRIFSGVKHTYSSIGTMMIVIGIIVSIFVPVFVESTLPSLEVILLFLILCLPFGLSYFMLPPSLLIIADQKEYKISFWIQAIAIIRMILMIIVILSKLPYIYIFIIEGLNVLIGNTVAYLISIKYYPWLKRDKSIKANADFNVNAKHTIIQRLSHLAIHNSDGIIISRFISLTAVSIYGAYIYLIEAALRIVNSAITSPINSFGNLFNSDKSKSYDVFKEYYELALFFASILSICIFVVLDEFVYIWVHQESYVLSIFVSIIFAFNVFYLTQRESVIIIRDANRLFIDAKNNAYLMCFTKILLSLLLVKRFGITGVLFATLVSYITVDFTYNPKLVFSKVFNADVSEYYKAFFSRIALSISLAFVFRVIYQSQITIINGSFFRFILSLVISGGTIFLVVFILYYVLFSTFRKLVKRVLSILNIKIKES